MNFYDTAGSVKHLMAAGLTDTAGIAPELAARQYGGEVLVAGIEDHAENFTRFHLLVREPALRQPEWLDGGSRGTMRKQGEPGLQRGAPAGDAGAGAGRACPGRGEPDQDRVASRSWNAVGVCFLRRPAL